MNPVDRGGAEHGAAPPSREGGTARPLLLVGTGERVKQALAQVRAHPHDWVPVGALDDNPANHGSDLDGIPVLGALELAHLLPDAALLACDPCVIDQLGLPIDRWVRVS